MKKTLCFVLALCLLLLAGCSEDPVAVYTDGPIRQTHVVETELGEFELSVALPTGVYDLSETADGARFAVDAQVAYLGDEDAVTISYGHSIYDLPKLMGKNGNALSHLAITEPLNTVVITGDTPVTDTWDWVELKEIPKGEYVLQMEIYFYEGEGPVVNEDNEVTNQHAHIFEIPILIR